MMKLEELVKWFNAFVERLQAIISEVGGVTELLSKSTKALIYSNAAILCKPEVTYCRICFFRAVKNKRIRFALVPPSPPVARDVERMSIRLLFLSILLI